MKCVKLYTVGQSGVQFVVSYVYTILNILHLAWSVENEEAWKIYVEKQILSPSLFSFLTLSLSLIHTITFNFD